MLLTMLVLSVAACLFSLQLRKLQKEGEALAAGNLDAQVDTKWMYWDVKRHAENLNSIGDGMLRPSTSSSRASGSKRNLSQTFARHQDAAHEHHQLR